MGKSPVGKNAVTWYPVLKFVPTKKDSALSGTPACQSLLGSHLLSSHTSFWANGARRTDWHCWLFSSTWHTWNEPTALQPSLPTPWPIPHQWSMPTLCNSYPNQPQAYNVPLGALAYPHPFGWPYCYKQQSTLLCTITSVDFHPKPIWIMWLVLSISYCWSNQLDQP